MCGSPLPTIGIDEVNRIAPDVIVKIRPSASESDRILGSPAAGSRIVVAGTETHQLYVLVIEAAGEAEGLEVRICVAEYIAEFIVIDALSNGAVACVDDQPRAARVSVRLPAPVSRPSLS